MILPTQLEIQLGVLRKYGVIRYKDSEIEIDLQPGFIAKVDDGIPMLPLTQGIADETDSKMPKDMLGYSCGLDIVERKQP